jgi:hypothetical protein
VNLPNYLASTQSLTLNLPGVKPVRKVDNLTAISEPIFYKNSELRRLTIITGLHGLLQGELYLLYTRIYLFIYSVLITNTYLFIYLVMVLFVLCLFNDDLNSSVYS